MEIDGDDDVSSVTDGTSSPSTVNDSPVADDNDNSTTDKSKKSTNRGCPVGTDNVTKKKNKKAKTDAMNLVARNWQNYLQSLKGYETADKGMFNKIRATVCKKCGVVEEEIIYNTIYYRLQRGNPVVFQAGG